MGAAAHDPLDALVIGAGFSGLYTLHRLVRVGYGSVCWRWPKTSAGPGYTTETRAHVATSRASNTPTASAEIHALSRIDIRDRDGMSLGEFCCSEGRSSYFGLAVGGFLNLFTGAGPGQSQRGRQLRRGSGAVCGVDQRLHCLPARQRIHAIEALPSAQQQWVDHAPRSSHRPCWCTPRASLGTTAAMSREKGCMGYTGDIPECRRRCDEIAARRLQRFQVGLIVIDKSCGITDEMTRMSTFYREVYIKCRSGTGLMAIMHRLAPVAAVVNPKRH